MKERKILKNKIYLYLTEFFAGMSVMAVELGASRLMAPYFSSSQIVWTIIIGTIMIAMALGNIYGGRSADRNPDPDKLYARILLAALWIAAIPVLGKYVIIAIAGVMVFTIDSNFLVMAAFAACMIVFVFPLFLLGTVTPSLVKYTIGSLDDSGRTVGTTPTQASSVKRKSCVQRQLKASRRMDRTVGFFSVKGKQAISASCLSRSGFLLAFRRLPVLG